MTTEPVDARLMYLAGLFEGEGSACITKHKHSKSKIGYCYSPHLSVNMTDNEPIKAFCDYFGSDIYFYKQQGIANWPDVYRWHIGGRDTNKVAKALMPHILTPRKRGALKCVIDFAATIGKLGEVFSPELLQKRDALYLKCKAFNARGIDANNRSKEALVAIEAYETDTAQMLLWA